VEYQNYSDKIQVSAALSLARSSYLLGCVEAHKKFRAVKGANVYCRQKARESVKRNIISILKKQNPAAEGKILKK